MVRVFDPSAPEKTPGGGRVYVTNLNEVLSKGRAPARPMSREAFETAALAAHPTGESSPLAAQTMRPVPIPAADGGAAPAPASQRPGGRPWSRSTERRGAAPAGPRASTSPSRKIPFADKDVERDADAARELAAKAAKMGIPTDRVPVIDVRGRLLLGFECARIEALLGEADMTRRGAVVGAAAAARRSRAGGGGSAHDRSAPGRARRRHVRLGHDPEHAGHLPECGAAPASASRAASSCWCSTLRQLAADPQGREIAGR